LPCRKSIAFPDEIQDGRELRAALRCGAARLLFSDHVAPDRLERLDLNREVLIRSADPRISDGSHDSAGHLFWRSTSAKLELALGKGSTEAIAEPDPGRRGVNVSLPSADDGYWRGN
jgi:hypothetical protein